MIDILFENDNTAICVKPVGVVSQSDGKSDMTALLSEQLKCGIYPVHRLDTAVGGVMVFAKNSKTAANLSRQLQDGTFKKRYLAVIKGNPEKNSGVYEDLLFKDSSRNKTYVVKRERRGVKHASLEYETVGSTQNNSLVKILLHTGRTHQIRVQFASRKVPLLGDGKYGGSDNKCGLALWSYSVEIMLDGKMATFFSRPDVGCYPWSLFADKFDKI